LAFERLKEELCKATTQSMSVANFSKPYLIEVGSSANTVGAALLQSVEGQGNKPIAFASQKLTTTQKAWSTIEKEASGLCKNAEIGFLVNPKLWYIVITTHSIILQNLAPRVQN